jgi:hypothetical protein
MNVLSGQAAPGTADVVGSQTATGELSLCNREAGKGP